MWGSTHLNAKCVGRPTLGHLFTLEAMRVRAPLFGEIPEDDLIGQDASLEFFGYEGKEAEPPTCHVGTLAGASPVITAILSSITRVIISKNRCDDLGLKYRTPLVSMTHRSIPALVQACSL